MGRKKARRSNAAIRLVTAKPQAQASASAAVLPVAEADIAFRAYSKWLARGCPIGDDAHDWFAAETEIRRERQVSRLHAVV